MPATLESSSRELLERLSKEDERPVATAGTHLVGGLVKCGAKLEALLRVVVQTVADADGLDAESLVAAAGGRPLTLRKAMAGPLAHGLKAYLATRRGRPLPLEVKPILDDLARRDSRILEFITLRNEIAKEGGEPQNAKVAMRKLRDLVATLREKAGWQ